MKTLLTIFTVFGIMLSQGFAGTPAKTKCPIEGRDIAGKKTSEVAVSFCCKKCKGKFDAAPASFIAEVARTADGKCPLSGEATDEKVTSTLTIGTCCGDCKAEFDKDPKKHLVKAK